MYSFKILFCVACISVFTLKLMASDTLYFVGNIKVSKKVSYKYNLRFAIDAENRLTGYSLSDPGGPNETKTKISGNYDSVNMVINYEEKNVLRSKVDLQKSDLCFVKASLKFKKSKTLETLSGRFTGFEPGKTEICASGEIKLINTDRYKVIMKQIGEDPASQEANSASNSKDKTVKITSDKGKEFLVTGNTVKFTIWDNGQIDGDRISIMINGKTILQDYNIAATAKVMEIPLSDNAVDTVTITALNEGTLPPNTAAIQIDTKSEQYQVLTQAKVNEVRTIYLRKKTAR